VDLWRHAVEVPADLVFDGLWPVRFREPHGLDGIRSRTQRVRAHVADSGGLTGSSGSGRRRRSPHIACTDATGIPTADPFGGAELAPGEGTGPGDESPRPVITWSLSLK
jgi:hypothetical protein